MHAVLLLLLSLFVRGGTAMHPYTNRIKLACNYKMCQEGKGPYGICNNIDS